MRIDLYDFPADLIIATRGGHQVAFAILHDPRIICWNGGHHEYTLNSDRHIVLGEREVVEWFADNIHHGWRIEVDGREAWIEFDDDAEAVHFKLRWG